MSRNRLRPALLDVLRDGYSSTAFSHDLLAGVLVGIIALPLSIALAIASGAPPAAGVVTAVVAGGLISLLGGSRYQVGGPTGAFVVLVYQIIHTHGLEGLAVATLMAGVILVLMGFARLGNVIRFIPYPVTVGFTAGIAVIIFAAQIRDFLGLEVDAVPPEFMGKIVTFGRHLNSASPSTVFLALASVLIIQFWPRVTRKIPGSLIAVVLGTLVVHFFRLPVETIGSRYGSVASSLPMPRIPHVDLVMIRELVQPATAIALLAGIESLLSAVIADGMTGRRHDSNTELIALGVANIVSPLFGGLPATGALARTATNIKAGASSPVAGIVHALTLLLILLLFGKWAALIPMPTLSAILVIVAYHMGQWHLIRGILRSPRSDVVVLVTAFLLTVLVDITVAIEVGVVMAALLFMRRMAEVSDVSFISESSDLELDSVRLRRPIPVLPPGVEVYELQGAFFFGAADKFRDALSVIRTRPQVLVLRMRGVAAIDSTGLRALEDIVRTSLHEGTTVVISGLQPQPRRTLERNGLLEVIGVANLCLDIDTAIERADAILRSEEQASSAV